jgi:hypothetical protein
MAVEIARTGAGRTRKPRKKMKKTEAGNEE